jgi:hypothetical protein
VLAQIYRYRRHSDQPARQKTKWVVWGFTAALAGFIAVELIGWIFALTRPGIPELFYKTVGNAVITLCALLIPLSICVAILRYRLWNIDLIIKYTLIYSSLSAVLTAMFAITDTLLQSVFFFITGVEQSRVATLASVIVIAVGFQPLRNRIERGVNRLLDRLVGGDRMSEALR